MVTTTKPIEWIKYEHALFTFSHSRIHVEQMLSTKSYDWDTCQTCSVRSIDPFMKRYQAIFDIEKPLTLNHRKLIAQIFTLQEYCINFACSFGILLFNKTYDNNSCLVSCSVQRFGIIWIKETMSILVELSENILKLAQIFKIDIPEINDFILKCNNLITESDNLIVSIFDRYNSDVMIIPKCL